MRLIDVAPDGLARDVCMGLVRARYRNGVAKPKLIKPGEVVRYTIRLGPTSNAFLPGHRIRLDVTSSDFPNFDRNHNTAADQNADATLVVADQTIHHGVFRLVIYERDFCKFCKPYLGIRMHRRYDTPWC